MESGPLAAGVCDANVDALSPPSCAADRVPDPEEPPTGSDRDHDVAVAIVDTLEDVAMGGGESVGSAGSTVAAGSSQDGSIRCVLNLSQSSGAGSESASVSASVSESALTARLSSPTMKMTGAGAGVGGRFGAGEGKEMATDPQGTIRGGVASAAAVGDKGDCESTSLRCHPEFLDGSGPRRSGHFWEKKQTSADVEVDTTVRQLLNVREVMKAPPSPGDGGDNVHWRAVPSLREIWETEVRGVTFRRGVRRNSLSAPSIDFFLSSRPH